MRKKLLIVICAMLMMFGSALSVSAEETTTEKTYYVIENGTRHNMSNDYFSYESKFSLTTENIVAGYVDEMMSNDECTVISLRQYIKGVGVGIPNLICDTYNITDNGKGTVTNAKDYYTVGSSTIYYFYLNYEKLVFSGCDKDVIETSTNIPYFSTYEEMVNYMETGDSTGQLNDLYDEMETDETFGLTGFTADNTITASWTGTTHDDVIDTYNQADAGIRPWYYYKSSPEMLGFKSTVIEEYEIANKTFTKLYDELTPSDETLFLRCLEVIPTYQKESLGAVYKGKSCWIWFDEDGNVEKIENEFEHGGGSSRTAYDYDLQLTGLQIGWAGNLFDSKEKMIYWSGTTKDDVIKEVGYTNTYVDVQIVVTNESGETKVVLYKDLYESVHDWTYPRPYIRANLITTSNSTDVGPTEIAEYFSETDFVFSGEVRLEPHYIKDSRNYTCTTSVVNIYTKQIGTLDPENPDEPIYNNDPEEPETDADSPIPDVGDIDDISDVIPWFINVIKVFVNGVGQIPTFLSYLFPYLPSEISYMLSLSLFALLILRIVGR